MKKKIDGSQLNKQLCFPLYVASKETVRKYRPFLEELDLTYTQYITLLALWGNDNQNVKDLGNTLFLDSGTLTPVLKSLENKGFVKRNRLPSDERNLVVSLTEKGLHLKRSASSIPEKVAKQINISNEEYDQLYTILYKIIESQN